MLRLVWSFYLVCAVFAVAEKNVAQNASSPQLDPNKALANYWVLRIKPKIKSQVQWLDALRSDPSLDFWSANKVMENTHVMVPLQRIPSLVSDLDSQSMEWEQLFPNVYSVVQEERAWQSAAQRLHQRSQVGSVTFDRYLRFEEMVKYMQELSQRFSSTTDIKSIGFSTEGRPIPVFIISDKSRTDTRPLIIVEAGSHGREWITSSMALYIIHEIVEKPENVDLYADVDWHIIPVLNPDGYEYSHSQFRMWRKTRSKHKCVNNTDPNQGVDINRNFDFHWDERDANDSPCSNTYAGPEPFSEPETRALRNVVMANRRRTKLFLSLHSYGRHILYPWSYTSRQPDNWHKLSEVAYRANKAQWGRSARGFEVGSAGRVLYPAAGTSTDWVRSVGGVEFVYIVNLPGGGDHGGFDVPTSKILPTVTNFFPAVRVFAQHVANPTYEDTKSRATQEGNAAVAVLVTVCCTLIILKNTDYAQDA